MGTASIFTQSMGDSEENYILCLSYVTIFLINALQYSEQNNN
jgi:hypothetical protein